MNYSEITTKPLHPEYDEFYWWLDSRSWLCGCGDPDSTVDAVCVLLERARDDKPVIDREDCQLAEAVANVLENSDGLLEHGTSIHYAWLTKEGEKRLQQMRKWAKYALADDPNTQISFRHGVLVEPKDGQ